MAAQSFGFANNSGIVPEKPRATSRFLLRLVFLWEIPGPHTLDQKHLWKGFNELNDKINQ